MTRSSTPPHVLSVSDLVKRAKSLLEDHFGLIWLEAEISNFSCPASGHWYFSLKDDSAQIRATCFRHRNQLLSVKPKDGDKVLVRARVSLYEARGDFQINVEYMEAAGYGKLQQQFEALKEKLANEGLFAAARKKKIPPFLSCLGIVTSPTGAAIRDVLTVLARRAPQLRVIIYPAQVQGNDAARSVIKAIQLAEKRAECDALLITRGGGSFEDLFCFNDEALARQMATCSLPTISAIGHEIDFTIADFVADLRAPTPSAAAEILARDSAELRQHLLQWKNRLHTAVRQALQHRRLHSQQLQKRLPLPLRWLERRQQRMDDGRKQLLAVMQKKLHNQQTRLTVATSRLQSQQPQQQIRFRTQKLLQLKQQLQQNMPRLLLQKRQQCRYYAGQLQALSPLATLSRGYGITRVAGTPIIVNKNTTLTLGQTLETLLQDEIVLSQFSSRKKR